MSAQRTVTVIRAGLQATVQDLGRSGFLGDGIPPSGAFDAYSYRLGQLLVGNPPGDRFLVGRDPGAAGVEALLGNITLRAGADVTMAVTGAVAPVRIDGERRPMWESLHVRAGSEVRIGAATRGARVYIAFDGGIDVPLKLGSRATHARARLGGLAGRALEAGDRILLGAGAGAAPVRSVREKLRPDLSAPWTLDVVLGPQHELFTAESIDRFLSTDWELSTIADRMGCRFVGPSLDFEPRPDYLIDQAGGDPSNIVDDVTPIGGIQVPSGLEPIAMGVDVPSIGGYAKIATVISAHIPRLAQVRPGSVVRFRSVEVADAVSSLRSAYEGLAERAIAIEG